MNQLLAHKHITTALKRLEDGDDPSRVVAAIKAGIEELDDPFAGEIDEFIKTKSKQHPQDESEDRLEDESDMPDSAETSEEPQEQLEEELEEEGSANPEDTMDSEDNSPQEKLKEDMVEEKQDSDEERIDELEEDRDDSEDEIEKLERQTDRQIESRLKSVAQAARERGYKKLAYKIIKATYGGDINILNELMMKEALKRDILTNYCFVFDENSPEKKQAEELRAGLCERIRDLQRYIVKYHKTLPALQRFAIPPVNPTTPEAILKMIENLEARSKADYHAALQNMEDNEETLSLKIWMEKIVSPSAETDESKLEAREDDELEII